MKRVLALLSLVCALFAVSACHFDVNLSVDADATLYYPDSDVVSVGPAHYEGFHHKHLSDYDLEDIFIDLTKHVSDNFTTAVMHLAIYDEISGKRPAGRRLCRRVRHPHRALRVHRLWHPLTARPRNTKKDSSSGLSFLLRTGQHAAGEPGMMLLRENAGFVHSLERPGFRRLMGAIKDDGMRLIPGDVRMAG